MSQLAPEAAPAGPSPGLDPATWSIRLATPDDLPALRPWLPADAESALPEVPQDAAGPATYWLLACRRADGAGADDRGEPRACLRLRRRVGMDQPRHWFHHGCVVHAAPQLQLYQRQDTLLLGNNLTGACELADLTCDAAELDHTEQAAVLGLLVRAALLLIAARRDEFPPMLIAELAGPRDAHGQSPFWLGLGRHFYAGDPQAALQAWGPGWLAHLAPLLPRQPVYCAFLPEAARLAVGRVDAAAEAAHQALCGAGLTPGRHVRVHDAGPVHEAPIDLLGKLAQARPRRLGSAASGPVPLRPVPTWWLALQQVEPPVWTLVQGYPDPGDAGPDSSGLLPAGDARWSLSLSAHLAAEDSRPGH